MYLVPLCHQHLGHSLVFILVDLGDLLRLHNAGIPGNSAAVHTGNRGDRVYISGGSVLGGKEIPQPQEPEAHGEYRQDCQGTEHDNEGLFLVFHSKRRAVRKARRFCPLVPLLPFIFSQAARLKARAKPQTAFLHTFILYLPKAAMAMFFCVIHVLLRI